MTRQATLPAWAKAISPGIIEIQADQFYPALLEELGVEEADIDQYWLETAYQCAKLDVQFAVAGTEHQAAPGGALRIIVKDTSKAENGTSRWAQIQYPEGKGAKAAAQDKEARAHYKRLRNLPL